MKANKLRTIIAILVLYVLLPAVGNPAVLGMAKIWVMFVIGALGTVFMPAYSPSEPGPAEDRGSYLLIIWSLYITQLALVLEANYLNYPQSYAWSALNVAALVVALAGLVLRSWAVQTLGRFFTVHVRVQEGHEVVEDGPYRYIRHPSYTGALLTYLGTPLLFSSYWTFFVSLVVLPPIFLYRVKVEEQILVAKLGEPYRRFQERVGALLPGLGRKSRS